MYVFHGAYAWFLTLYFQKRKRHRLTLLQCHCGKSFQTVTDRDEHVRDEHKDGYMCNVRFKDSTGKRLKCKVLCKDPRQYSKHKKTHLPRAQRWNHLCSLCDFGTNEPGALVAHMVKIHDQQPDPQAPGVVRCARCGKYLHSKRYLKDFHKGSEGCVRPPVEHPKTPPSGFAP
jgi:hypothetical protein